jgi:hypothetical protein
LRAFVAVSALVVAACDLVSGYPSLPPIPSSCDGGPCLPCVANAVACEGQQLLACAADGASWANLGPACATGTTCDPRDEGRCDPCAPGSFFCVDATLKQCSGDGRSSDIIDQCASPDLCALGGKSGCPAGACAPGELRCSEDGTRSQHCNADQTGWDDGVLCAPPQTCGGSGVVGVCGGCAGVVVGTSMIAVDGHCIDVTPVTQSQYQGFLESVGEDTSGQREGCEWNMTFTLDVGDCGANDSAPPYDPVALGDYPAVCVDWCDAAAYCAWAGKRLCGARDGSSLAIATGDPATVTTSEWLFACTQGGVTAYPYGPEHTDACGLEGDDLHAVGSLPYCHGQTVPFTQLLDMNGAIVEWEDACVVDGAGDSSTVCRTVGGDACNTAFSGDRRAGFDDHRGFRCCAD